jgi:DNA-binding transcriptional LysR family regulator
MEFENRTHLELRHIRYFLAVAAHGHFGRAAEACHVSQPALSQQIRELERLVGADLFLRHPRGANLTPAGEAFADHARRTMMEVQAGITAAQVASRAWHGRIVVGLAESPRAIVMTMAGIDRLRQTSSGIDIETTGLPWLEQPAALRAGKIDVGFSWSPGAEAPPEDCYGEGIVARRLYFDPGDHALLPLDHALADRTTLDSEDLRSVPVGLFAADLNPTLHAAVVAELEDAGLGPVAHAAGVASVAGSIPLMQARRGWTVVTRSFAAVAFPGMAVRPIRGFSVAAGLDVIWRKDDGQLPTLLVDAVVEAARGEDGPEPVAGDA